MGLRTHTIPANHAPLVPSPLFARGLVDRIELEIRLAVYRQTPGESRFGWSFFRLVLYRFLIDELIKRSERNCPRRLRFAKERRHNFRIGICKFTVQDRQCRKGMLAVESIPGIWT